MAALWAACRLQAGHGVALRGEQDDVVVHRIFADIFSEARFQCVAARLVRLACGSRLGEGADVAIAGQEADVGRALEQVAYQHIDGDPGAGAEVLCGLAEMLPGQLLEQLISQLIEILAHAGDIGAGAEQLAQQGQVVVGTLNLGQALLVGMESAHVTGQVCDPGGRPLGLALPHGTILCLYSGARSRTSESNTARRMPPRSARRVARIAGLRRHLDGVLALSWCVVSPLVRG